MAKRTYYQIKCGTSLHCVYGHHNFYSEEEATKLAKEFKANPRSQYPNMTDEQVKSNKNKKGNYIQS